MLAFRFVQKKLRCHGGHIFVNRHEIDLYENNPRAEGGVVTHMLRTRDLEHMDHLL